MNLYEQLSLELFLSHIYHPSSVTSVDDPVEESLWLKSQGDLHGGTGVDHQFVEGGLSLFEWARLRPGRQIHVAALDELLRAGEIGGRVAERALQAQFVANDRRKIYAAVHFVQA